jgi:hypothetical protein
VFIRAECSGDPRNDDAQAGLLRSLRRAAASMHSHAGWDTNPVFVSDEAALAKLGLDKAMPGRRADFIKTANLLFNTSSYTPEMTAALLEVGWDNPEYSEARGKIAEYDTALSNQATAKSNAQKAKVAQKKALKAMDDWMAKFINICRVVFKDENAQFLESFEVTARTAPTKKQREGRPHPRGEEAAEEGGVKILNFQGLMVGLPSPWPFP